MNARRMSSMGLPIGHSSRPRTKIVVVGPTMSGKTALSNFLGDYIDHSPDYRPTKGVRIIEFDSNDVEIDGQKVLIDVEVWDCSSSDKHRDCWDAMRFGVEGIILVADPNRHSGEDLLMWYEEFVIKTELQNHQVLMVLLEQGERKTNDGAIAEFKLPSKVHDIRLIACNLDHDGDGIRLEFNAFLVGIVDEIVKENGLEEYNRKANITSLFVMKRRNSNRNDRNEPNYDGNVMEEGPCTNTRFQRGQRLREAEANHGGDLLNEVTALDISGSDQSTTDTLNDVSLIESIRGEDSEDGDLNESIIRPADQREALRVAREQRRRQFLIEREEMDAQVERNERIDEMNGEIYYENNDAIENDEEVLEQMMNPNLEALNDSIGIMSLREENPNENDMNSSIVGMEDIEEVLHVKGVDKVAKNVDEDMHINNLKRLIDATEPGRIRDVRDEGWRIIREIHCKYFNIAKQPVGKIGWMQIDGMKREVVHGNMVISPILTEDDEIYFSSRALPQGVHTERFRRDMNSKDKRLVMTCKDYGSALSVISDTIRLHGRDVKMHFEFAPGNDLEIEDETNAFTVIVHDERLKDFLFILFIQLGFGFDWKGTDKGIATHEDSIYCKKAAGIFHRVIIGGSCLAIKQVL